MAGSLVAGDRDSIAVLPRVSRDGRCAGPLAASPAHAASVRARARSPRADAPVVRRHHRISYAPTRVSGRPACGRAGELRVGRSQRPRRVAGYGELRPSDCVRTRRRRAAHDARHPSLVHRRRFRHSGLPHTRSWIRGCAAQGIPAAPICISRKTRSSSSTGAHWTFSWAARPIERERAQPSSFHAARGSAFARWGRTPPGSSSSSTRRASSSASVRCRHRLASGLSRQRRTLSTVSARSAIGF